MKTWLAELPECSISNGGIWKVPPVRVEPRTFLFGWQVYEVLWSDGVRSRHFVGHTGKEGRVTSEIIEWDLLWMSGTARSKRIYELCSSPGEHPDAHFVWQEWLKRAGNPTVINVTEEYN